MQNKSDAQLLRAYVESGQETAFREIVTRHSDLVYSAALRQVNSPDLARDLAQGVFTDLARKARPLADKLADDSSLVGWLYRSTRFAALKHLRDDRRRLTHERQAMEQLIINSESAPDWEQLRPVLDETMADLNEEDREALLLRYFKNCDFQTVGQALGVSDAAAQKRVSRALDKLRERLSRRGITTTPATLSAAISVNAVQAAPVGLAMTISTAATAGTTMTAAAATATKGIAMTTLQKTIIGTALAAVVGTGIYEARQAANARAQVGTLQGQPIPLADQIQQLQRERDEATTRLASLAEENAGLKRNPDELLRLRGLVGVLRTQLQEATNVARRTSGANEGAKALGEPLPDIDARIVQLSRNGTTAGDVLQILGEPEKYCWKTNVFKKDELPNNYILAYSQGVQAWVTDGLVRELRSERPGPGFTWQGTLRLGSSLDEAVAALGPPTKAVVGQPNAFEGGVLYQDIEGQSGRAYYARPDKNIRLFFVGNKVTSLYLTPENANR
jgi:RNA polymerase sigma factor (sigma-70 family)